MSFWSLSDGEDVKDTGTDYEMPGGNLTPIPDGSAVMALVETVKWTKPDDKSSDECVEITWTVGKPDDFKNRKIFQKLWVDDMDPRENDIDKATKKRDRARRMLAAIDANAGGKLTAKAERPTDETLQKALINKAMVISLGVWSLKGDDGNMRFGNWVRAVGSRDKEVKITDAPLPKPTGGNGGGGGGFTRDMDDDIPFGPSWK